MNTTVRGGQMIATSTKLLVALLLLGGAVAVAGERAAGGHAKGPTVTMPADDLKWGPGPKSLPAGAEAAVLEGDPAKPGPFVLRLKVPAGYKIAPHTHPRQERVTVISGKVSLGHGRTFDEAKLQDLEAGSFFSLPPGMEHYVRMADETVVQLNGEGPWEIKYVNPQDDPRKAKSAAR